MKPFGYSDGGYLGYGTYSHQNIPPGAIPYSPAYLPSYQPTALNSFVTGALALDEFLQDHLPENDRDGPGITITYPTTPNSIGKLATTQLLRLKRFYTEKLMQRYNNPKYDHQLATLNLVDCELKDRDQLTWQDYVEIITLALRSGRLRPETEERIKASFGSEKLKSTAYNKTMWQSEPLMSDQDGNPTDQRKRPGEWRRAEKQRSNDSDPYRPEDSIGYSFRDWEREEKHRIENEKRRVDDEMNALHGSLGAMNMHLEDERPNIQECNIGHTLEPEPQRDDQSDYYRFSRYSTRYTPPSSTFTPRHPRPNIRVRQCMDSIELPIREHASHELGVFSDDDRSTPSQLARLRAFDRQRRGRIESLRQSRERDPSPIDGIAKNLLYKPQDEDEEAAQIQQAMLESMKDKKGAGHGTSGMPQWQTKGSANLTW